jgi:hypothetical protein
MYDNFLENDEVYFEAEKFWISLFTYILNKNSIDISDWIYPFYNTTYSNGNKFMDGNPIFSAHSIKEKKRIRIIQEKKSSSAGRYNYWHEPDKNELVIVWELSSKNKNEIKKLIGEWTLGIT